MGGRGGSSSFSGKTTGIDVTSNGDTTRYYFTNNGGTNYYQRGVSGSPEPTPMNMSAQEFRRRVQANGATVRSVSAATMRAEQKKYASERKAANDLLDKHDVQNNSMRKGSRANIVASRVVKRKR